MCGNSLGRKEGQQFCLGCVDTNFLHTNFSSLQKPPSTSCSRHITTAQFWGIIGPSPVALISTSSSLTDFFFFFSQIPWKKRISYFIFKDRFYVSHFPRHLTHVIQKCWAVLRGTNEYWYRPHKETRLCSLTSHSVLIKNKLPFPLTPSAAFQHPSISSKILDILYLHLIKHLRA